MKQQTFHAALQATARIACCAVLISCQKQNPVQEQVKPPMQEHAQQQAEKPAPKVEKDPIQEDRPREVVFSDEFNACNEPIAKAEQAELQKQERLDASQDVKDCCLLQSKEVDTKSPDPFAWKYREYCCPVLEWQGSMACTPWGPPTPPAFA